MDNVINTLASSPVIAQIVPENKGYVLSAEDDQTGTKTVIFLAIGIAFLIVLLFIMLRNRRHRKRHYKTLR